MSTRKFKTGQRGATLIEAIIAIGVLGIAVGAATTYFAQSGTAVRVENVKEAQRMIANKIQLALANPESINRTLTLGTGMDGMKACAYGPKAGKGNCIYTKPLAFREFSLIEASSNPVVDPNELLSGSSVGWDVEGNRCVVGAPNCLFTVATKFWATCDPIVGTQQPNSVCGQARFLNFKYVVKVSKQFMPGKAATLSAYPSQADYDSADAASSVRVRTADLVLSAGGVCGRDESENKRVAGFDRDGRPICRCIDGSPAPADGVKCANQACPAGNIMVGFKKTTDSRGNEILAPDCLSAAACEDPNTFNLKCPCKLVDLQASGDCGTGFWMVHIDYGECKATTEKDGKGGPETVKCSNHTGKCCKMDSK